MPLTRRSLLGSVAASALIPIHKSSAMLLRGGFSQAQSQALQVLKLGAGGNQTGVSISNSAGNDAADTLVIRCDTYNCYINRPNGFTGSPKGNDGSIRAWQTLFNQNSMPPSYNENMMYTGVGSWEICIAPSNAQIIYATTSTFPSNQSTSTPLAGVFKTINGGDQWAQTGFTPVARDTFLGGNDNTLGPSGFARLNGQKMAIHPTNPNIVFLGLGGAGGMFASADGGVTWGQPSGIPAGTGAGWITGILFNPTDGTHAYAFSQGNGFYVSTNANLGPSSTWTQLTASGASGGPSSVRNSAFAKDGSNYYVCTASGGNILRYNISGNSWATEVSGNLAFVVACDPSNASHVLAIDSFGNLNENLGSGWSGWSTGPGGQPNVSATDIPWLAALGLGCNTLVFSPTNPQILYTSCNNSFFTLTLSSPIVGGSTVLTWNSMNVGEEQLNPNIIICPSSGNPLVGVFDNAWFVANLTQYPLEKLPDQNLFLSACWSADNAKFVNTNFVVTICDNAGGGVNYGNGTNGIKSAYSSNYTNGSSWTKFLLSADGVHPCVPSTARVGSTGNSSGNIAVSDPNNFVWAPAGGIIPQFTTNAGVAWNPITVSGSPSFSSFLPSDSLVMVRRGVAADPNTQNAFYMFFPGVGFFRSTNSGSNWSATSGSASRPANIDNCNFIMPIVGQSGHVWFNASSSVSTPIGFSGDTWVGGVTFPNTNGVFYTTDGGATFNQVNNANFSTLAQGAAAPGQSYPAIYGVGFIGYNATDTHSIASSGTVAFTVGAGLAATYKSGAPVGAVQLGTNNYMTGTVQSYVPATGVVTIAIDVGVGSGSSSNWLVAAYGIWQNTTSPAANPVWTQLGPYTDGNTYDFARALAADPVIFGQLYIGFAGSGCAVRM
jgi:hypothetical protein